MCEGVVLELPLRDTKISRVGVRIALVRVKLVERFLLIVLTPTTVGSIHATIDACSICANRCESTTLLESRLTNIHARSEGPCFGEKGWISWFAYYFKKKKITIK